MNLMGITRANDLMVVRGVLSWFIDLQECFVPERLSDPLLALINLLGLRITGCITAFIMKHV